uniref:CID domain-containing protein n=1 Tax=Trypanosoma congolense (strain IL3000) TaxID=1068625 RepID=G0UWX1_TRYCI|nr:conserved hypothetical protein [Trypanosoma congolense IL3000]
MNKERVCRRLDLVGTSAGSIISVATWCALHASSVDVIMGAFSERMRDPSTSDSTRCALLYVIHELVLTCAANGVPEAGKRRVLMVASRVIPEVVVAVRALGTIDIDEFERGLSKVTSWWSMLNIFPRTWIEQLKARGDEALSREAVGGASIPTQLRYVAGLMARYTEAKEEWLRATQSSPERVALLRDEALQRLSSIRTVVDGKLEGGVSIASWLNVEQSALMGSAQNVGASFVGKQEEDDILGTFFQK